jgi:hypothetical protein
MPMTLLNTPTTTGEWYLELLIKLLASMLQT